MNDDIKQIDEWYVWATRTGHHYGNYVRWFASVTKPEDLKFRKRELVQVVRKSKYDELERKYLEVLNKNIELAAKHGAWIEISNPKEDDPDDEFGPKTF